MTNARESNQDFEDVFRRMWPSSVNLARRLLGDQEEAEDAAAEGLARALVRWQRVGRLPYVDAWIMRVVSNVAIDRARARRRADALGRSSRHDEFSADPQDASVARITVVRELHALPKRQREAVVLRYVCELTEREIAEALGISGNSVKKHLSRATDRLRARIGPQAKEIDLAF